MGELHRGELHGDTGEPLRSYWRTFQGVGVELFYSGPLVADMASSIGEMAVIAHRFITSPQTSPQAFCNVIKLGTFCRTVVWPCLPPLMMYQYIRGKDEDMYSIDVLYYKSGSSETKAFWDGSRVRGSGHWRLMQDLETIRAAANSE